MSENQPCEEEEKKDEDDDDEEEDEEEEDTDTDEEEEEDEEVLSLRKRCEAFGVVPKEEEEDPEDDAHIIEDALTRAEVLWRRPGVEVGMVVELHSLKTEEALNGEIGECLEFTQDEQWKVRLLTSTRVVCVLARNLRRADPVGPVERAEARDLARRGAQMFQHFAGRGASSGEALSAKLGPESLSVLEEGVTEWIAEALRRDPACSMAHHVAADLAFLREDAETRVRNLRRAVANGYGDITSEGGSAAEVRRRIALAASLGSMGELELEADELRRALRLDPGNVDARHTLGQNCFDRGDDDSAIAELTIALDLTKEQGDAMTTVGKPVALTLLRAYERRARILATEGDHDAAVDLLRNRALKRLDLAPAIQVRLQSNTACSLAARGNFEEADAALDDADKLLELVGDNQTVCYAVFMRGKVTDARADSLAAAGNAQEAKRLYAVAREIYRRANSIADSDDARNCFRSAALKAHPDTLLQAVPNPAGFHTIAVTATAEISCELSLPPGPNHDAPKWGPCS